MHVLWSHYLPSEQGTKCSEKLVNSFCLHKCTILLQLQIWLFFCDPAFYMVVFHQGRGLQGVIYEVLLRASGPMIQVLILYQTK